MPAAARTHAHTHSLGSETPVSEPERMHYSVELLAWRTKIKTSFTLVTVSHKNAAAAAAKCSAHTQKPP